MERFTKNNSIKQGISKMVYLFVFMFSLVAYSQSNDTNSLTDVAEPISKSAQATTSKSSSMEFVLWFMGSKQNPNTTISSESNTSTRNQIINSGLAPNRLLIKAFLKKAVNFETATV
ncbi:hypothetical protein [Flavobacterium sp. UMI-01]|uniref:hypothetical protein n=1 Tax=Flavobacterium sp. UMI-01 TaxID=1441053 RepID=UPI001C7D4E5D|nr:hypothetical protein [Flavobacterium sp. UMI-01]GIZ08819.1 hypothetical protein FUMI01_15460 [Flavobacterium sp. UMI-01]